MSDIYAIPKGEIVWVSYNDTGGNTLFLLTSKPNREYYYLYSCDCGSVKKIGKNRSPYLLEDEFNVIEKCSGNKKIKG